MAADGAQQEELTGRIREISLQELMGEPEGGYKRREVRMKEEIYDDDPYFRVIDAGHDLLMEKKKAKELVDHLPAVLQSMLAELEGIMKEITLAAMEDSFDYRTQVDRYYFYMMRINYLSSLLAFRMQSFVASTPSLLHLLDVTGKREREEEVRKQLQAISGIGDELKLSSNLFMNHLEKEYSVEMETMKKRELVREKAQAMMH